MSLTDGGEIWIVEVKSCLADFRSDRKWQAYIEWCDKCLFAVGPDFPENVIPPETGLIIADPYEGILAREPVRLALPPIRRKALTLQFVRLAARPLSGARFQ